MNCKEKKKIVRTRFLRKKLKSKSPRKAVESAESGKFLPRLGLSHSILKTSWLFKSSSASSEEMTAFLRKFSRAISEALRFMIFVVVEGGG